MPDAAGDALAPLRVAVAGKGGAGKSVLSGTMARCVARRGGRVLAMDSDLLPGLSMSLGSGPDPVHAPLWEATEKRPDGKGFQWREGMHAALAAQRFAIDAPDGVRLLLRGKQGPDGFGSVIGASQTFFEVVHGLVDAPEFRDWTLIGDLPAGQYQVADDWAPYARIYLVVVQPTMQSALTGRRILRVARRRSPEARHLLVANRVRGEDDVRHVEKLMGETAFASLPFDEDVAAAERLGRAPIDHAPECKSVAAIERLIDALLALEREPPAPAAAAPAAATQP
jgi:CO dehydrogenase maturation factor